MKQLVVAVIYAGFFLSGAAALIYQVVWVRSLILVFGGSHLAVTTVLAVFMGGLALGSHLVGKKSGGLRKPLRFYGLLELGIALSGAIGAALMYLYPTIYVPLARVAETSPLYLTALRIALALAAMIVPTTLMGGTLPVLAGFVTRRSNQLRNHLSFLYGFNTFGAIAGAAVAGFLLLPAFSVSATLALAVCINTAIGILSILLQDRAEAVLSESPPGGSALHDPVRPPGVGGTEAARSMTSDKLVLWGIGLSGFCALGYEVLWTRILSIVIGASVYGFTIMLMAFLAGIAAGGTAYGLRSRLFGATRRSRGKRAIIGFGLVQMLIGATALAVTVRIRNLPADAVLMQGFFPSADLGPFAARQAANLALAFAYMFVPAFFMGYAFPLAGQIRAAFRKNPGHAVGEIMAYNTIGALLGSAISGYLLVYLLGIERSLQTLTLINIGFGLLVVVSVRESKVLTGAVAGASIAAVLLLAFNPRALRVWDGEYFALYQATHPEAFGSPETIKRTLESTEVLYYAEGAASIVSSVRSSDSQWFITNGRVEASNSPGDIQVMYTLGHLPMLLAKDPRKVFVLGAGSGMTLGATSVHPGVEQITLAEIEPKVLGVTRTFGRYNHEVLANPKLKVIFNDGRNALMTTREKFDVITADPIHPWFSGAGYLYSDEFFRLAGEHLNPGGIICHWLPIYELTAADLRSIVRTFRNTFKHSMVWLTHSDAELIGSNEPILIDETQLAKRLAAPEVAADLGGVMMGTVEDLLSYFLMGNAGMASYAEGGVVNTDDNVYLEFSAPRSFGVDDMERNFRDMVRFRESILPYLRTPTDAAERTRQSTQWKALERASLWTDSAHAAFLGAREPEFAAVALELDRDFPTFAPWLFLRTEALRVSAINARNK